MLLTVNLPGTPKDEPLEVSGFGVFANGYVYEVETDDSDAEDVVVGVALDSPPVKLDQGAESNEFKRLMRMTHAELDALADQSKVTFDEGMPKEEKVRALLDTVTEGDD